jgi:LCP family protein required for cell wall assembly
MRFVVRFGIALIVTGLATGAAVQTVRARAEQAFNQADTTPEAVRDHLDAPADPTPDVPGQTDEKRTELPQNFLLVGSDSRANYAEDEGFGSQAEVTGNRADAIMVVRVDPANQTVYVLSIPRDTWVMLPTIKREGRINEALTDDVAGPDGPVASLIDTVRANFGVPINHYIQVDFAGVEDIVNALGGVDVSFIFPSYDAESGLDVGGGCQHLDGGMALAYARSRHLEQYVDGKWVLDQTSDFGRIRRQQDLVRRLVKTANANAGDSISKLNDTVNAVVKSLTLDPTFRLADALNLVTALHGIDPDTQQMRILTVHDAVIGGAQVLTWNEAENSALLDPFRVDPTDPSEVRVQVVDGTGGTIAAGGFNYALGQAGFRVLDVQPGGPRSTATEIRYPASNPVALAKAEYLARWLDGPHTLAPVLYVDPSADVEVLVGSQTPTVRTAPVSQLRPDDLPPPTAAPTTTTTTTPSTAVTEPPRNLDGSLAETTTTTAPPPATSNLPIAPEGGANGDLVAPLDLCAQ